MFDLALLAVSVLAAGVASLSGFGIGSLLTPLLATQVDLKLAVAAISIPHIIATALRCWMLREHINKKVLLNFGLWSAAGGLIGAVFHAQAKTPVLLYAFAGLLLYVGVAGLIGWSDRWKIAPKWAWSAGLLSGGLGGIVGNQGGIRAAALLGLELSKLELVATATAIGVVVDLARMPIYFASEGSGIASLWWHITIATIGCITGTLVGKAILTKLPEKTFRTLVFALILLLGICMFTQIHR